MKPIPEYGDLMTMEEFLDSVACGALIDYDGHGNYATETEMSDIVVVPSDVRLGRINMTFSHVVWFNR